MIALPVGGRVVRLSYELGIHLAGDVGAQDRVHRAVLATFRWVP